MKRFVECGADQEHMDCAIHNSVQLAGDVTFDSEDEYDASIPPLEEVTALCWCAASLGVARFLRAECRIEVFEVPVCMVAGETVRRGRGGVSTSAATPTSKTGASYLGSHRVDSNITGSSGDVRIVAHEDIPPSLLWLVRYLQVHQPQVLLPHTGSEAVGDLIALVAEQTPIEVIRLSAATAFCGAEALPRLASMYPAQTLELAARFHTERIAMMRSMAALLQFVAAVQSNVADVVEREALHALYLDDACAEALQITRSERHPSSGQGRGRAKEGHSLRGLLSTAQCSVGRAMLRQWIALPCSDAAEIETRQSVVAFFVNPVHHDIAGQLRAALHRVRSTTNVFTLMRSGRALHKHYISLYQTLQGVIKVQELLATVAHAVSRLYVLLQSISVEPLRAMAASLVTVVVGVTGRCRGGGAGGGSHAGQSGQKDLLVGPTAAAHYPFDCGMLNAVLIRDGADTVLDELRTRFNELRFSLQAKAEAAFAELPWTLRSKLSLRCVYTVPHGYLLCVPATELTAGLLLEDAADEDEQGGDASGDDDDGPEPWGSNNAERAASASPKTDAAAHPSTGTNTAPALPSSERVFAVMENSFGWRLHHTTQSGEHCFKSAAMEDLDNWVGDLQRRVQQREERVRRELDTFLLYNSLHLLRPTRALGELDCLLSFARVSAQERWCRPEIVAPMSECAPPGVPVEEEAREGGILVIEDGWHPLLSRHVGMQQLIPFSLHLHTSTDRVCLVLGVNGSGKSVLMGAVAHIVFLAHLGCHVPAMAVRLSLFNSIFAPSSYVFANSTASTRSHCFSADVSVTAPGSFYAECVALHRVLHFVAGQQRAREAFHGNTLYRNHTAGRALVLLDEFGRGTSPEDSCALLKATLRYFADGAEYGTKGSGHGGHSVPVVLCATHLVEMLGVEGHPAVHRYYSLGAVPDDEAAEAMGHSSRSRHREDAGTATARDPLSRDFSAQDHLCEAVSSPLTADTPLPFEWIKIYEMESHAIYADDQGRQTEIKALDAGGSGSPHLLQVGSDSDVRFPVDVTPTYQPVCLTPHTGPRRQQDWVQHSRTVLGAGPVIGRQCGLDGDLLTYWEATLRVLHRPL